jgi:MFS family permease
MTTHRVPRVVWVLGLVSLCMDLSSEMIHALLPVFVVSVLGASPVTLGLIEGIAEGTASIAKVFSGVLSDRLGHRKALVLAGYGLATLSKPLFPLATSAAWILVARFADRIGKGIRGAPRDALVADVTPPDIRGASYGLRQSLDTAGALLGPLVAMALMWLLADNVRLVFWIAVLPAMGAVALLMFGVKEPENGAEPRRHSDAGSPPRTRLRQLPTRHDVRRLGTTFWAIVAIGAVVTLARFSEAFLVLHASEVGLSFGLIPLTLAIMNAAYVISAYPAGRLSDRIDRVWLLTIGMIVLIAADIVLAWGESVGVVLLGVAMWGLHMGLTQGLFAALVADVAPADLRGSAFGFFNFVSGVFAIASGLLTGVLWKQYGSDATFLASAGFSGVGIAALLFRRYFRTGSREGPHVGSHSIRR